MYNYFLSDQNPFFPLFSSPLLSSFFLVCFTFLSFFSFWTPRYLIRNLFPSHRWTCHTLRSEYIFLVNEWTKLFDKIHYFFPQFFLEFLYFFLIFWIFFPIFFTFFVLSSPLYFFGAHLFLPPFLSSFLFLPSL